MSFSPKEFWDAVLDRISNTFSAENIEELKVIEDNQLFGMSKDERRRSFASLFYLIALLDWIYNLEPAQRHLFLRTVFMYFRNFYKGKADDFLLGIVIDLASTLQVPIQPDNLGDFVT